MTSSVSSVCTTGQTREGGHSGGGVGYRHCGPSCLVFRTYSSSETEVVLVFVEQDSRTFVEKDKVYSFKGRNFLLFVQVYIESHSR